MDMMTTAKALYVSTRYAIAARGTVADWVELTGLTMVALSRRPEAHTTENMKRTHLMNVGQVMGKLRRMKARRMGTMAVARELGV